MKEIFSFKIRFQIRLYSKKEGYFGVYYTLVKSISSKQKN